MGLFTSLFDQDGLEWQIYTDDDICNRYHVGDKVRELPGDHLIRDFCYLLDENNSYLIGWLVIKDGVFKKSIIVQNKDDEDEKELDFDLVKEEFGLSNCNIRY